MSTISITNGKKLRFLEYPYIYIYILCSSRDVMDGHIFQGIVPSTAWNFCFVKSPFYSACTGGWKYPPPCMNYYDWMRMGQWMIDSSFFPHFPINVTASMDVPYFQEISPPSVPNNRNISIPAYSHAISPKLSSPLRIYSHLLYKFLFSH